MAKNSTVNLSKYRSPPVEPSSHREEVEVVVDEEEEDVVEVSEAVVVEDPTLTLRGETGPAPTALVAT